jgi:hypothetical protein
MNTVVFEFQKDVMINMLFWTDAFAIVLTLTFGIEK